MATFDRANRDRDDDRDGRDYDGGNDDDDNEGSHLPVVIIIAILVLAAFGGVVWLAYNQGVARGRTDGPVRVAATTKADDSGIKVYQQSAGPEEEAPKAADPVQAAPPPIGPAPAEPTAAPPSPNPVPAPVQAVPAPPPLMAPKPQQQAAAAKPNTQPATDELAKPQVATKPPAQLGGARPAPLSPAVVPAPKTAAAAPTKPVTSGGYLLQVGAFKSDAEARAAWKAYQAKHAALLNGFGPDVQKVDLGDKGTWYRLRIAAFADKDAASAVCERLKSQGGACFLAK
jgi:hypothetical protein